MKLKRGFGVLCLIISIAFAFSNINITGNVVGYSFIEGAKGIVIVIFFLAGLGMIMSSVFDKSGDPLYRKKADLEERAKTESLTREGVNLPSGTFYGGPAYTVKLHPEMGYHAHLLYDNKDTNYFITIFDGYFIAVPHGEGAKNSEKELLDIRSKSAKKRMKVDLRLDLKKLKKRGDYRPVPTSENEKSGLVYLFPVSDIS